MPFPAAPITTAYRIAAVDTRPRPSELLGRCDLLEKNREFVPVFEVLPPSAANVYPARPCDDSPLWRPSWAH